MKTAGKWVLALAVLIIVTAEAVWVGYEFGIFEGQTERLVLQEALRLSREEIREIKLAGDQRVKQARRDAEECCCDGLP